VEQESKIRFSVDGFEEGFLSDCTNSHGAWFCPFVMHVLWLNGTS